jgi:phosphinothricin acetyltransferase
MIQVRLAVEADAEALAAIYGHHVLHGLGTFEEDPPSPAEMDRRRRAIEAHGLPHFVAEEAGHVVGFAYAAPFRARAAYRYTVEDSVYVAPDRLGRGVGRAALSAVLAACEARGLRQAIAVIGGSDNAASIGLHRALGFEPAGVGRSLGFKQGRWIDVVWMQRALGRGDDDSPDAEGLILSGH